MRDENKLKIREMKLCTNKAKIVLRIEEGCIFEVQVNVLFNFKKHPIKCIV